MFLGIAALELSFVILLVFMLGLSGVVGFVVLVRVVEPRGLKALSQRLVGLPRPKGTAR